MLSSLELRFWRYSAKFYLISRCGLLLSTDQGTISCHAFKLGISSEQDAKPAAWLRLTHYKDCAIIDIKV